MLFTITMYLFVVDAVLDCLTEVGIHCTVNITAADADLKIEQHINDFIRL